MYMYMDYVRQEVKNMKIFNAHLPDELRAAIKDASEIKKLRDDIIAEEGRKIVFFQAAVLRKAAWIGIKRLLDDYR